MSIFLIAILFISITAHEYAHGWMADKKGDSTARLAGRLTLNPITHIDIFGTIILPIILLLVSQGQFSFGYAKPIPINPYYFKNPARDTMLVGLAGPMVNITLAFILTLLYIIQIFTRANDLIVWGIAINLILTVFNLLPIPPLDGSKIIASFMPRKIAYRYLKLDIAGYIIILILITSGLFNQFIVFIVNSYLSLLKIKVF